MNLVCEQLKIRYPIIQGGMGNISHAALKWPFPKLVDLVRLVVER